MNSLMPLQYMIILLMFVHIMITLVTLEEIRVSVTFWTVFAKKCLLILVSQDLSHTFYFHVSYVPKFEIHVDLGWWLLSQWHWDLAYTCKWNNFSSDFASTLVTRGSEEAAQCDRFPLRYQQCTRRYITRSKVCRQNIQIYLFTW